ncbi:mannosyl-oligosaccharide glucosidase [Eremomyces bilateralis CBS 781.70]|uniref:Mannosyl-oligosaccharide glucosidase n=1 Tax=Eremomyces bilateralis CBS 781.70 TaxID=1392243 RepID=A0A6G1G9T9_9PEZI|nr:mannosyl-oligosaccharide glucosidase [Eremomyces bilateralis CBS 781.70]KAF1814629.1 mannosyl-oligosaccharide glucosidase [Eremomyces bilateralis CBS 781.70]
MARMRLDSMWMFWVVLLLRLVSGVDADTTYTAQDIERISNNTLLWGPYRPNLYFGTRPRIPNSLLTGLLFTRVEDYASIQHTFRHTCEQNENMAGYGWDIFDPRLGGIQTIRDTANGIDLTTSFIKDTAAGDKGGNWGVRISGKPREKEDVKTTVIFYTAREGLGGLEVETDVPAEGVEGDVVMKGESGALGDFTITVTGDPEDRKGINKHPFHSHVTAQEKHLDRTFVNTQQLQPDALWQTKPILFQHLKTQIEELIERYGKDNPPPPYQLYTIANNAGAGNLQFVQKVFEGPFEFDILFNSGSAPEPITSTTISSKIEDLKKSFAAKFKDVFKPSAPFTGAKYEEFAHSLFSNLIGGLGYFHGDSLVDRSYAPEYEEENEGFWDETADARSRVQPVLEGPSELFTSIPSRPFFPRGFLWDEGFHLIPILDWDVDLTLQITKSWFNLMDDDGWIAREQILGPEARSKVPAEFQVQYPHYANPPTLFLIISSLADKLDALKSHPLTPHTDIHTDPSAYLLSTPGAVDAALRDLYPLLTKHYAWFRRTQAGDVKSYDRDAFSTKEAYRWRGRTTTHLLTSGLDDYPRAQPPHPGELHVDALSWVGLMASSLARIATFLSEDDDAARFAKHEAAIRRNVDDLHWSAERKMYCDASIDDYEEHVLVCHAGYVSLFPFMVGLMDPAGEKMGDVLDLIANPAELWSEHGIRSLGKGDALYGTEEDYWRSPVWLNMNYLIVSRLLSLAQTPGPHQSRATTLYAALRRNLVTTVYTSWKETGFAWEQYHPETGAGQRTQHFTGWTSLVVKILGMPEIGGEGRERDEL